MRVRVIGALAVLGGVMLLGLVGGATRSFASSIEACAGGRPLCGAITDTDFVSKSTPTNGRFMNYSVVVRNSGTTSQLTNVTVTATLNDVLDDGTVVPSSAVFVASQSTSQCQQTSTNVLSCVAPNLGRGQSVTYEPLVFRTSTGATVAASRLTLVSHAKETVNDHPRSDPQQDTAITVNDTTYESSDDRSASYAYPGSGLSLNTAPSTIQSSVFPLAVPTAASAFVATLEELPTAGSFCPGCFGQIVRAFGGGIFSAANPFEVLMTTTLAVAPRGTTEATLTVRHLRDGGVIVETQNTCSGAFGTTPPASELPCRRVMIDRFAGLIRTDFFDFVNGDVGIF